MIALVLLLAASPSVPDPDLHNFALLRREALEHSQAWDTVSYLTDVLGARVTGSPALERANAWTRDKLAGDGLRDAHLEPWTGFGRGWTLGKAWLRMTSPDVMMLTALPRAFTPGTNGIVRGRVVRVDLDTAEQRAAQAGKLAGAIVLLSAPKDLAASAERPLQRFTDEELKDLERVESPAADRRAEIARRIRASGELREWLVAQGVVATLDASSSEGGRVDVGRGGARQPGESPGVPSLAVIPEHYNRLARLAARGLPVDAELEVEAAFHDAPQTANTIADIPGTDKAAEIVMIGAHLDSWYGGTGATDNAVGVAAVMEAARVIQSLGLKPRRTIRVALWTGEEQGVFGSRAYVRDHLATFPEPDAADKDLPAWLRMPQRPSSLKPEHARLSVYLNADNGGGRIRGIYADGNLAAAARFRRWLEPLRDLGAGTVTLRGDTNTDHESFREAGIPAFGFLQDALEYDTRTHHTNVDVLDRLRREDLAQMAAVIAAIAWQAANSDDLVPRVPLPGSSMLAR